MARYILLFVYTLLISSCMTLRPDTTGVSNPDYNGRQHVSSPHYVKRPNAFAYIGTLATTAGGVYGMYKLGPVTTQNAEGTQKVDAANIALGALTGFAIGTALQYAAGKNKRVAVEDPKHWLEKADKKLTVYQYNSNSITTIPLANEHKYSIQNLDDLKGYYRTFPYGALKSSLYTQSVNIVKRAELPEVVSMETDKTLIDKAKYAYFDRSQSVDQLIEANARYHNFSFPLETNGIRLTTSYSDAKKMFKLVPGIRDKKGLYISSLSSPYQESEAVDMLQQIGKDNFLLTETDAKNTSNEIQKNILTNIFYVSKPKEFDYAVKIFKKYNFLQFDNKSDFILDYFWKNIYDKYTNGNKILSEFNKAYSYWGLQSLQVSKNDLESFIRKTLILEGQKNIHLVQNGNISTKNDNIEAWKKSIYWDALLIHSSGELKYLEYGLIENQSKFDLPVVVNASADLLNTTTADFWNLFQIREHTAYLGSKSGQFIIPRIKAGGFQAYAILFDFGVQKHATGGNLLGAQIIDEAKLYNRRVELKYIPSEFTSEDIKRQNFWLDILKTGFKQAKTWDPTNWKGGFEYLPENYDMNFQKFIAQWRQNYVDSYGQQTDNSIKIKGDCTVSHTNNDYLTVDILDGGDAFFGAKVDTKTYLASYTTKNGKTKSSKDPLFDSSSDVLGLVLKNDLPVDIYVSYRPNGHKSQKSCRVTLSEVGRYEINIK